MGPQMLPVSHVKQIPSMESGPKWPIIIPHKGVDSVAIQRGKTVVCEVTSWFKIRLFGSGLGTGDEGSKEKGWGFDARKISSARFVDFGWESVGTINASFDIHLTFDLNVGFAMPLSSLCK